MAKRQEDGDTKQCSVCGEIKNITSFWKRGSKRKDGTQARRNVCASCSVEANMEKYYKEGGKEAQKERSFKALLKTYGITPEIYEQERIKQNYSCLLCGALETEQHHGRLYVDHNHATGKYRGLLCNICNTGLGSFKDDTAVLHKAIEYLNAHRS